MYSHGRKILTLFLTLLFECGAIFCVLLRYKKSDIFWLSKIVEGKTDITAFINTVINTWIIAFLFACIAFFPWIMRRVDWHITSEKVKEKYRHKALSKLYSKNSLLSYYDYKDQPKIKDISSNKGPDLIVGIVLATILFIISSLILNLKPSLFFLLPIVAYMLCFIAVFKTHEKSNYDRGGHGGGSDLTGTWTDGLGGTHSNGTCY